MVQIFRWKPQEYFVYFKVSIRESWTERSAYQQKSVTRMRPLNYSWGPAATRALPSSLPVYLVKFLMKRADRSLAFSSQTAGSA